jgi:hypothetical protein
MECYFNALSCGTPIQSPSTSPRKKINYQDLDLSHPAEMINFFIKIFGTRMKQIGEVKSQLEAKIKEEPDTFKNLVKQSKKGKLVVHFKSFKGDLNIPKKDYQTMEALRATYAKASFVLRNFLNQEAFKRDPRGFLNNWMSSKKNMLIFGKPEDEKVFEYLSKCQSLITSEVQTEECKTFDEFYYVNDSANRLGANVDQLATEVEIFKKMKVNPSNLSSRDHTFRQQSFSSSDNDQSDELLSLEGSSDEKSVEQEEGDLQFMDD